MGSVYPDRPVSAAQCCARALLRVFAVLCATSFFVDSEAQTMDNVVAILSVAPLGSARSPRITATEGQVLVVRPKVDDELVPGIFIYDADGALQAKNNERAESAAFEWTVTLSGSFEIVIYSNTNATVDYSVLRLPPPVDRAVKAESPTLAVMNVFWASNRAVAARRPVKLAQDPSPANALSYGKCEVSIPRVHKRGLLEGPSILRLEFSPNPEKHVVFKNPELLDADSFFAGLKRYSLRSTDKDALVFVHGFNVDFEDAARRAAQLSYDLQFRGPTVVFSWPSRGSLDPISYNMDRSNAELSAEPLGLLLAYLHAKAGIERIHVIAHSMGNVPLTRALAEMKDPSGIRQIALLAPDVDARMFENLARKFPRQAPPDKGPRVTLYASDRDLALIVSRRYAGYPRAGQGGPAIVLLSGVDTIDASSVDTSLLGVLHQYYADNSQVLGDLYRLLRGDAPENRFGLEPHETPRGKYYVFVPAAR
jgi:esterase/lipase superfamily enzyme